VLAVFLPAAGAPGAVPRHCQRGYSCASFQSQSIAYGVAARITALRAASVAHGQVAVWAASAAPARQGGADEWLQAGISGFPGGTSEL
jgi:hypothetical protein